MNGSTQSLATSFAEAEVFLKLIEDRSSGFLKLHGFCLELYMLMWTNWLYSNLSAPVQ